LSSDDPRRPDDGAAILSHATRCAAFEALAWIGEPTSALCLFELLGRDADFPSVAYHVGRLADAGLLAERRALTPDGALEPGYRPVP
jgi:hypothetical protein